nr:hypothetical protein [Anaerolineae bacterium]
MDNRPAIGWEQAVIGTVLMDPEAMEVASDLAPQDFTGSHKLIWREVLSLNRRNALEPRALIEALRSVNELDEIGADISSGDLTGEMYLLDVSTRHGALIEEYVRQVGEYATRRQLQETAALIAADAHVSGKNVDELLDEAERRVMALRRTRGTTGTSLAQILNAFMPKLEGMRSGDVQPAFVPHLQALRDVVDYFEQNEFVLIAGRPGTGKSAYLRYEAYYQALHQHPGLFINMENSEDEYAKSFIALATGIDSQKLRSPRLLSNQELTRVREAAERLASLPLDIISMGSPSIAELERVCRSKMRTLKPQYIMVDYVQLIDNGMENRVSDVTLTSKTLRAMAMPNRLNIPVIAAAQLSREIEKRGSNSVPQLSDLRESGSLEQDASIIIFPRIAWNNPTDADIAQFPENVNPTGGLMPRLRAEPVNLYVQKNRNGPTGVTPVVKWVKAWGDYQTLAGGAA